MKRTHLLGAIDDYYSRHNPERLTACRFTVTGDGAFPGIRTTLDELEVTCRLCLRELERERPKLITTVAQPVALRLT